MKKLVPLVFVFAAFAGCSRSTPLHDAMEGMDGSFKSMRASEDLASITKDWASFKTELAIAREQKIFPEFQATFDEGMEKLAALEINMDAAIAAGNLDEAKALMQRLSETRKEFHKKLEVK